jgi:APA family basic amino acid/polyamine antiporter
MSFFTLVVDGLVLTTIVRLRRRAPDATRPFRVPAYPLVPALAIGLYVTVLSVIVATQPKLALGGAGVLLLVAAGAWLGVSRSRGSEHLKA